MPCNAIATAKAKVDIEANIRSLISAEIAAKVIGATYNQIDGRAAQIRAYASKATIWTKNLAIEYNAATGDLLVSARMYGTQKMIDEALQVIPAMLRRTAAALVQQKVKDTLKASGARIESEQVTPTGAMILTVDM